MLACSTPQCRNMPVILLNPLLTASSNSGGTPHKRVSPYTSASGLEAVNTRVGLET